MFNSFSIWKYELINGGAHAEEAVQDDAQEEKPSGGPCERCVRKAGNEVGPDYSKNHIHDRDSADLNGMHALSGNPQRISVFAEACIVVVVVGCI